MREDWKLTRLGDICFIRRGSSPRPIKNYLIQEGGMPWVKISDATQVNGKYINSTAEQIKMEGVSRSVIVNPGDLILSNSGTAGLPMFMGITACIHDGWQVFRDFNGINKEYLYYFLLFIRHRLLHNAYDSVMKNLTLDMLRDYEVHLPSLEEQKRIVDFLGTIDKKIEINNKINRNLIEQAQVYFTQLFVVNPDENWQEGTLSDVGTVIAGGTPSKAKEEYYSEHGIAWITPKDLSANKSVFISHGENDISELGYEKSSATKMPKGTVLFSSRAPIGYIAIAANEVTTNQGFKSVVPKENVGTAYIYFLLKQLLPTIENMASGSTFKEISGSSMKTVPTVIPDNETLHKFDDFCQPLMNQVQKLEQESKRLIKLRDSLLPKLMSGELDVSDLDI